MENPIAALEKRVARLEAESSARRSTWSTTQGEQFGRQPCKHEGMVRMSTGVSTPWVYKCLSCGHTEAAPHHEVYGFETA